MVEDYRFGEIKILGKIYKSDVIIYPDYVDANWWRGQSHDLAVSDLKAVIESNPEVIIIGTGASGLMQVSKETRDYLTGLGIETIILSTKEACQEYNRTCNTRKAIACLHLTC